MTQTNGTTHDTSGTPDCAKYPSRTAEREQERAGIDGLDAAAQGVYK